MQYLYVLVSSPRDVYYEQFFLSLTSLRLVMPKDDVVLLCDSKTKGTLIGKRSGYERLVTKTVTVDAPLSMPQVEVSRWLKTSMRRHINDDFLFIDCDTVIMGDLSVIAASGIEFGACLDKHSLISMHGQKDGIIANDKHLGFSSYLSNRHFNSGVIFCSDKPEVRKIFDRWHELWLFSNSRNMVRDQPSFNMAIHENLACFTELDGIWNCQISFNGLPFFADSKIIHYFASDMVLNKSPFLLASDAIFKQIKETGSIPDTAMELLGNPKAAFVLETRIVAGEDMLYVVNSSLFKALVLIRRKIPCLFWFFNHFASMVKKTAKFFAVSVSRKKDGGIKHYN